MKCSKCGYDNKEGAVHCDLCKEVLVKERQKSSTDSAKETLQYNKVKNPSTVLSGSAQATDSSFPFLEPFRIGWNLMKEHFWLFMGIQFVIVILYFILVAIFAVLDPNHEHFLFDAFILLILCPLIVILTLFKISLKILDNEEVGLGNIFSGFTYLAKSFLSLLLILIPFIPVYYIFVMGSKELGETYLGLSLYLSIYVLIILVPYTIYFAFRLIFTNILITDNNYGPIESIKKSYSVTQKKYWQLIGFLLIAGLLNLAGAFCFSVGLIITIPITSIAFAYTYRIILQQFEEDERDRLKHEKSIIELDLSNQSDLTIISIRKKVLYSTIPGVGFIFVIGLWLSLSGGPIFRVILGVGLLVFYGYGFISLYIKHFLKNTAALSLSSEGIIDYHSKLSASWSEITNISTINAFFQPFITINVRNPEAYLRRGNFFNQIICNINYLIYKTPIIIPASMQLN